VAAHLTFDEEEDRLRRRDRACVLTGLGVGAGVGAFAALFVPPGVVVFALIAGGAMAGGIVGKSAARRISTTEWDPLQDGRPHVGAVSPDDDITS
jgi:hypothetical protein